MSLDYVGAPGSGLGRFGEETPTPEDLIARAVALRPQLLERQAEVEALGGYPPSTHRDLLDAGLYRVIQPRKFGGYQFDIATYLKIVVEIARGCPSTAWSYALASAHQLQLASLYPEAVQRELFSETEPFLAPLTHTPGLADAVDGGYVIKGTFRYASGGQYASHYIGQATVVGEGPEATPLLFIAPHAIFTRRDDWGNVLGMRGSSSNTIDVEGFVPERYTVRQRATDVDVDGGTIGSSLHDEPGYAIRLNAIFFTELAAVAVGTAWAAYDEFKRVQAGRQIVLGLPGLSTTAPIPALEHERVQTQLGGAHANLAAAELALLGLGRSITQSGRDNIAEGAFNPLWDVRHATTSITIGRLAFDTAMDTLIRGAGSAPTLRNDQRMQRYARDLTTYWVHATSTAREMMHSWLGKMELLEEGLIDG